MDLETL